LWDRTCTLSRRAARGDLSHCVGEVVEWTT
jgi:hypothetical protein